MGSGRRSSAGPANRSILRASSVFRDAHPRAARLVNPGTKYKINAVAFRAQAVRLIFFAAKQKSLPSARSFTGAEGSIRELA